METKKIKKKMINKDLVTKAEKMFKKNKSEIVLLILKAPSKSFTLNTIVSNYDVAIRQKNFLEKNGHIIHICYKSKGDKHTAAYLSDFNNNICITYGINRTIELHNKHLRYTGNKKAMSKNSDKEKSGYMGFAFHYPSGSYIGTRLYDNLNDATNHIEKRSSIDKQSVDIIDSSRLHNGKFRFSSERYEKAHRIKHVKRFKLIERFGQEEATIILETIKNIKDDKPVKIESIKDDRLRDIVSNVTEKIKETPIDIINDKIDMVEMEKKMSKIEKSKELTNEANNNMETSKEIIKILTEISNKTDSTKQA